MIHGGDFDIGNAADVRQSWSADAFLQASRLLAVKWDDTIFLSFSNLMGYSIFKWDEVLKNSLLYFNLLWVVSRVCCLLRRVQYQKNGSCIHWFSMPLSAMASTGLSFSVCYKSKWCFKKYYFQFFSQAFYKSPMGSWHQCCKGCGSILLWKCKVS